MWHSNYFTTRRWATSCYVWIIYTKIEKVGYIWQLWGFLFRCWLPQLWYVRRTGQQGRQTWYTRTILHRTCLCLDWLCLFEWFHSTKSIWILHEVAPFCKSLLPPFPAFPMFQFRLVDGKLHDLHENMIFIIWKKLAEVPRNSWSPLTSAAAGNVWPMTAEKSSQSASRLSSRKQAVGLVPLRLPKGSDDSRLSWVPSN